VTRPNSCPDSLPQQHSEALTLGNRADGGMLSGQWLRRCRWCRGRRPESRSARSVAAQSTRSVRSCDRSACEDDQCGGRRQPRITICRSACGHVWAIGCVGPLGFSHLVAELSLGLASAPGYIEIMLRDAARRRETSRAVVPGIHLVLAEPSEWHPGVRRQLRRRAARRAATVRSRRLSGAREGAGPDRGWISAPSVASFSCRDVR
jgi:hypothetical protein